MSKIHKDAALPQEALTQVQEVMRHHMEKHQAFMQETLSPSNHRVVVSFIQQQPAAMLAVPSGNTGPQSGVIFGILKGMKESMETNMAKAQEDEESAISEFASLKAAKTKEMAAGENLIETKTVQMAEAKEKNAQSKEDLVDTRATLSADTEFLSNLNLKCQNADHEYEQRVKIRNEELVAVSETIGILTDDDAKDQFNKSMGFFQVSAGVT